MRAGSAPSRTCCSSAAAKASTPSSPTLRPTTARYPYHRDYRIWPGPNSNTFVADLLRQVPELACELPPTAIGKDYLVSGIVARAPSGSGFQISLWGVLGVLVGVREGLEINVLGLVFGIDPGDRAIKLPMLGRVRMTER